MKKSHSINLSNILPFKIKLSSDNQVIQVSKGVMYGEISWDSLELELIKNYPTQNIKPAITVQKNGSVIITIQFEGQIDLKEIEFISQQIVSNELPLTLKNLSTKKPLIYIPDNYFGIPLIGSMYFGVIDRGTSLLQLRTLTGCPLNCPMVKGNQWLILIYQNWFRNYGRMKIQISYPFKQMGGT
ncbi:MAG: hypothetical protein ACTSSH_12600 [Candidatus Heimdallarchaeota archaeon]